MADESLFNPLDKQNLGKSIVDALLQREECPLANLPKFKGAGVYAIYYSGSYAPYTAIAEINRPIGRIPIYVGKAIPKGGRKGATTDVSLRSTALHGRLTKHAASIEAVKSLQIRHFTFRRLVVDDIWIPLGENLLIEKYQPLWNTVVEGFGNHDPGAGRYSGKRPLWDELHPGRQWATKCAAPDKTSTQIKELIAHYLKSMSDRT